MKTMIPLFLLSLAAGHGTAEAHARPGRRAGVHVEGIYGVYRGDRRCRFDDVQVLPVQDYPHALHDGDVF